MQGSTLISQLPWSEKCRLKLFPAVLNVGSDLFWLETRSEHLANSSLSLWKVPEQLGKKAEGILNPRTDSILSHRGGHVFLRGPCRNGKGENFSHSIWESPGGTRRLPHHTGFAFCVRKVSLKTALVAIPWAPRSALLFSAGEGMERTLC